MRICQCCAILLVAGGLFHPVGLAADFALRDQELPTRLDVGYAVRLIDMNHDQRLDIAIVDSKRILWLANPDWTEHVIFSDPDAKNDNVCFAPLDIDKDGRLDFALGRDWQPNNTKSGGTIGWIRQPEQPNQPWTYHPIAEEPTTHRMQFVDLTGDGREELLVSPLKGRGTSPPQFDSAGVRQLSFAIPADPREMSWPMTVINDQFHVTHNFQPLNWDQDPANEILFVSFDGVHLLDQDASGRWQTRKLGIGEQNLPPNRGASEIKAGKFANGTRYIATIEPWHGERVVVYTEPPANRPGSEGLWQRHVIDAELKWGHAVACANLDGDADEELIIGVRDDRDPQNPAQRRGVRVYDPSGSSSTQWTRQIVDPGSVAIEDLVTGDLNGDGRNDIVAVGRQTHNVKIYWNETPQK